MFKFGKTLAVTAISGMVAGLAACGGSQPAAENPEGAAAPEGAEAPAAGDKASCGGEKGSCGGKKDGASCGGKKDEAAPATDPAAAPAAPAPQK
jgi:hypothetical protein